MEGLQVMTSAESAGGTTRKPGTTFEEMLNAVRDSLSDHAIADNEQDSEDKEDEEKDPELSMLSDEEPGLVLGTIS
jgi:hypothetical protein